MSEMAKRDPLKIRVCLIARAALICYQCMPEQRKWSKL